MNFDYVQFNVIVSQPSADKQLNLRREVRAEDKDLEVLGVDVVVETPRLSNTVKDKRRQKPRAESLRISPLGK